MYVCMYVFIKLHITTQSGPVILVILCHSHYVCMFVCMYVCMYVFIKLHITTQSGQSFYATRIDPPVCMYVCNVRMYVCMYIY